MTRLLAVFLAAFFILAAPAFSADDGLTYTCRTSKDCTIVEIPSVCGKVPVCASTTTALPEEDIPVSTAQADLCEFKEVTGCYCLRHKCRANRDMSHFPNADNLNQ